MTQTIGLVRGGLVINKIFIDSNKSLTDVKHNTKNTALNTEKH
ncbi:MAG: hypothetical protein AAFW70_14575 [Cyanobacteria bacterium J06635_10]